MLTKLTNYKKTHSLKHSFRVLSINYSDNQLVKAIQINRRGYSASTSVSESVHEQAKLAESYEVGCLEENKNTRD